MQKHASRDKNVLSKGRFLLYLCRKKDENVRKLKIFVKKFAKNKMFIVYLQKKLLLKEHKSQFAFIFASNFNFLLFNPLIHFNYD